MKPDNMKLPTIEPVRLYGKYADNNAYITNLISTDQLINSNSDAEKLVGKAIGNMASFRKDREIVFLEVGETY